MTVHRIETMFGGSPKDLAFDTDGADPNHIYIGVSRTVGSSLEWTHVSLDVMFKALADEFPGKRITVADVEVIPATVTVKNEAVYGG